MIRRDGSILRLEGPVTLETVGRLLQEGRRLLDATITGVDLSGVGSADSSALALLLEWSRQAGRQDRRLRLLHAGPGLANLVDLYGLEDVLPVGADA